MRKSLADWDEHQLTSILKLFGRKTKSNQLFEKAVDRCRKDISKLMSLPTGRLGTVDLTGHHDQIASVKTQMLQLVELGKQEVLQHTASEDEAERFAANFRDIEKVLYLSFGEVRWNPKLTLDYLNRLVSIFNGFRVGEYSNQRLSEGTALMQKKDSKMVPKGAAYQKITKVMDIVPANDEETAAFRLITHDEVCHALQYWFTQLRSIIGEQGSANIGHGIREEGVDVLLELPILKEKFGFQVKSYSDIEEEQFSNNTKAQITSSRKHSLTSLFLVLCGDLTNRTQRGRIRSLVSDISQLKDGYCHVIEPNRAIVLVNAYKDWRDPRLHIRGMSTHSKIDLDLVDWRILDMVEQDSGVTDTAITGRIALDKGQILGRLKALEANGYLRLEWITKAGLRICGAHLTTKGIELLEKRRRNSEETRSKSPRPD